jgi:hypothetical protein
LAAAIQVNVYPNPATDYISISYSNPELFANTRKIEITDLSGTVLMVQNVLQADTERNLVVNVANLPGQGMYLLHAWSSRGHFATKFLKI